MDALVGLADAAFLRYPSPAHGAQGTGFGELSRAVGHPALQLYDGWGSLARRSAQHAVTLVADAELQGHLEGVGFLGDEVLDFVAGAGDAAVEGVGYGVYQRGLASARGPRDGEE